MYAILCAYKVHVMKLIRKRAIPQILKPPDRIRSSPDIETFVLKQTNRQSVGAILPA